MRMLFALSTSMISVIGCDVPKSTTVEPSALYDSEQEIMDKVFDPSYKVPAGFFVDERADTEGSYTIYHVKDLSNSYELCTDSYEDAYALESEDNARRSANGLFVGAYENERYFEFVRELEYPDSIGNVSERGSTGYSRVFKCSYLDRSNVERNVRDGFAGMLNTKPLTMEVVDGLVEYLWQFTFFWPQQKKVLDSFSENTSSSYVHTLRLALRTERGTEQCDLIEVAEWVFSADKNSGQLGKHFEIISAFEARFVDGVPEKCAE